MGVLRARALPDDLPDPMHPEPWVEQDEPLASDLHHRDQDYAAAALSVFLGPAHYVTRDRWLRMDPSNPKDRLLPDLLIALDLPPERRDPDEYDPEIVGRPPDLLAEYLSPSSTTADKRDKPLRYARLGVREYFLFDVDGRYRVPPVQGWRLSREGSRTRLPIDVDGGVTSEVIPVRFVVSERQLRVLDSRTGSRLPRYAEAVLAQRQAEEENARLRAEIERLRRERGRSEHA